MWCGVGQHVWFVEGHKVHPLEFPRRILEITCNLILVVVPHILRYSVSLLQHEMTIALLLCCARIPIPSVLILILVLTFLSFLIAAVQQVLGRLVVAVHKIVDPGQGKHQIRLCLDAILLPGIIENCEPTFEHSEGTFNR